MGDTVAVNNSRGLDERVVLITGGLGDIGSAITRKLASFGARVILFDLIEQSVGLEAARKLGAVAYRKVDQGDSDALHAGISQVAKEFSKLDIAIGNAASGSGGNLLEVTAKGWDEALRINLVGSAMLTQAAVEQMLKQDPDSDGIRGKIFFTSSWVGTHASPGAIQYCVSKAGLDHLVRLTAQEFATRGIRVNAVAPGILEAGLTQRAFQRDPSLRSKFLSFVPVGEFGTAEQVADAFIFLCSRESNYITGQILFVDGGCSLTKRE